LIADNIIYITLLALLAVFFIMQLRMMFFPHIRGKIIEFEPIFEGNCSTCRGKRGGKTSIPIKVRTDDGDIISAEISSCTLCMEKLKVGSRIGVTKVAGRNIAQACANIRKRNT
jgi:hypothetical protein